MKTAQWPQDIVVRPMEEIVPNNNTSSVERKVRPQREQALNCPRCNSTNTKFCYYNNYSLSQPRYFCKTCRRYWTEGGTLRSIPVGGGSRKNKKSSSSTSSSNYSSSSSSSKKIQDSLIPSSNSIPLQNPNFIGSQDLNLGFSHEFRAINELIQVPNFEKKDNLGILNPCSSNSDQISTSSHHLDLLTSGIGTTTSRGLISSFMSMPITNDHPNTSVNYSSSSSGFPNLPVFKPNSDLSFSLDGLGGNYGSFQGVQETNGKLLFPFADLNQVSSTNTNDADQNQNREQQHGDSTGFWNGVIGGSGSW